MLLAWCLDDGVDIRCQPNVTMQDTTQPLTLFLGSKTISMLATETVISRVKCIGTAYIGGVNWGPTLVLYPKLCYKDVQVYQVES